MLHILEYEGYFGRSKSSSFCVASKQATFFAPETDRGSLENTAAAWLQIAPLAHPLRPEADRGGAKQEAFGMVRGEDFWHL